MNALEKMARAIAGTFWDDMDNEVPGTREEYVESTWKEFRPDASAALEALLEPSEGMIRAVCDDEETCRWNDGAISFDETADRFRAMIQAALEGK